jgi:hypothetical protein
MLGKVAWLCMRNGDASMFHWVTASLSWRCRCARTHTSSETPQQGADGEKTHGNRDGAQCLQAWCSHRLTRRRRARRYNSNEKHQHEVDDMAAAMEPVLFEFGADIVFAGHVHAYERSHRIFRHGHVPALRRRKQNVC